jgi:hypothetical protein
MGMKTGNLTNYIKRGKVVMSGELIDDSHPINAEFVRKRSKLLVKKAASAAEKGSTAEVPRPPGPKISDPELPITDIPDLKDATDDDIDKIIQQSGGILSLENRKIAADIQRIETVRDLNLLKIQKEQGEIIPTELMSPIIAQFAMAITSSFRSAADNLLTEFAHKHKIDSESEAELRTKIVSITNEAVEKAVDESHRAVDRISTDYANKRGVGQRRA